MSDTSWACTRQTAWEWGEIAAGGTLVVLPVLVVSFVVRNLLVRGLTAGALKGWRAER